MPISTILKILGLTQKNHHFVSDRKREFIQLTTDYEKLLRQTNEVLVGAKLKFDTYLALLPLDVRVPEDALNQQIESVTLALFQVEEQRELQISTRARKLGVDKWDELISRRKTQLGAAEYALQNAESTMQKIETLCTAIQQ